MRALASLAMTCRDLNWAVETAEGVWEQMYGRDIPAGDKEGLDIPMVEPGLTFPRGSEGGRREGERGGKGGCELGDRGRAKSAWKVSFAAAWGRRQARERREREQEEVLRREREREREEWVSEREDGAREDGEWAREDEEWAREDEEWAREDEDRAREDEDRAEGG